MNVFKLILRENETAKLYGGRIERGKTENYASFFVCLFIFSSLSASFSLAIAVLWTICPCLPLTRRSLINSEITKFCSLTEWVRSKHIFHKLPFLTCSVLRVTSSCSLAFPPFSTGCSPQSAMAYFKSGYGVNGLHLPMSTMDAASLHHSMGYSTDPYLTGPPNR